MAKRKFIEKRRKERIVEREATIDPRDYRAKLVSLLENLNVDFETHDSENEKDDYYGFKLSYDPPFERMWYIVKNPFGGNDLELAIESGFDLAFGAGCWSFHPTEKDFGQFCGAIKAIVEGRGATVRFCVGDEAKASAVLIGDELDAANDFALMERIAERDYYRTNQDIYWDDSFALSRKLKKELRRLRSRNGWRADFEYFNPMQNRSVGFGIL